MALHLVTGYAGKEHVTSADQGAFHVAMLMDGSHVLNRGNKFGASIVSNNLIKVLDGEIIFQGRYIRLESGEYEEVTIENGTQDYKRNDLIVLRYTKSATTGVESPALVVIKGTPSTDEAVDPSYTEGSILEGDMVVDFPLYRVPIDGLNVGELVPLFDVVDNLNKQFANKAEKEHTHTTGDIKGFPTEMPPSAHTHSVNDIENFPSSMTPTAHDHPASEVTAGTLGGKVVANATSVATLGDKQVRNIHAGTTALTAGSSALPSGDIYIMYE